MNENKKEELSDKMLEEVCGGSKLSEGASGGNLSVKEVLGRQDSVYLFSPPTVNVPAEGGQSGSLTIFETSSISSDVCAVGVAMSGSPTIK